MKKLETNFRDGGFDYVIVEREGDVILAEQLKEDGTSYTTGSYIVFHVRKYDDRTIMDNHSEAKESVPPDTAWGDEAWSFSGRTGNRTNLEYAFDKFVERVAAQPESILIVSGPTGRPRGRERNAFELDLSCFGADNFLFSQIVAANEGVDEPMLRNRLKALVDAGSVLIVDKITGGKGKPKNIYQVKVNYVDV